MSEADSLGGFGRIWRPQFEAEMRSVLTSQDESVARHYAMMHYHLGWVDESFRPGLFAVGKRIRPLFCLLACAAVGGDPATALPAAAAVEILHNFSLIHDDIEDGDETRRHRPTLWRVWGSAQAINAGDGMFALAYAALLRSRQRGVAAGVLLDVLEQFTRCCTALTEGQHLDIGFEEQENVSVAAYLRMIEGKTASLLATSLSIGARIGGASNPIADALYRFGRHIGLAFQIQDDILGVWGDPSVTGKAAGNDILRRKKSLPLLYARQQPGSGSVLQERMAQPLRSDDLPAVLQLLAEVGARPFAEEQAADHHRRGMEALAEALGCAASDAPLGLLARELLARRA